MTKRHTVPDGWQPLLWAKELDRRASACDEVRPDMAVRYREWAEAVRDLHRVKPKGEVAAHGKK